MRPRQTATVRELNAGPGTIARSEVLARRQERLLRPRPRCLRSTTWPTRQEQRGHDAAAASEDARPGRVRRPGGDGPLHRLLVVAGRKASPTRRPTPTGVEVWYVADPIQSRSSRRSRVLSAARQGQRQGAARHRPGDGRRDASGSTGTRRSTRTWPRVRWSKHGPLTDPGADARAEGAGPAARRSADRADDAAPDRARPGLGQPRPGCAALAAGRLRLPLDRRERAAGRSWSCAIGYGTLVRVRCATGRRATRGWWTSTEGRTRSSIGQHRSDADRSCSAWHSTAASPWRLTKRAGPAQRRLRAGSLGVRPHRRLCRSRCRERRSTGPTAR